MYIMKFDSGFSIQSGPLETSNIRSCTVTQCVNSGDNLTVGSVCSACLEATIEDPAARIKAGLSLNLLETNASGEAQRVGRFRIKAVDKKGKHLYKVTAFDNVSELDKDLRIWLLRFDWSQNCTLREFASKVCIACGVRLKTGNFPNEDVILGTAVMDTKVTGRSLMRWCAEIAGRYCVADEVGNICFDWYSSSGDRYHEIFADGERHYYAGSFTYGERYLSEIDAVVIRQLDGTLWPETWGLDEVAYSNPCIIEKNMFLISNFDGEHRMSALKRIKSSLDATPSGRPFKISCPAAVGRNIHAGDTLNISDVTGRGFASIIMSKVRTGQKVTLECTGSYRRQN